METRISNVFSDMTEYKNTIAEALNTNKKDFITEYNQIAYDIEKINQLQLH